MSEESSSEPAEKPPATPDDDYEKLRKLVEKRELEAKNKAFDAADQAKIDAEKNARLAKLKDVGKRFASGAAAPVVAAGGAVGKGVKRTNNWAHGDATKGMIFLFWLAIVIQVVDVVLLKFNRTVFFATSVSLYLFLAVMAIWVFSKKEGHFVNPAQIFLFFAISFFYIIVPSLIYIVKSLNITVVGGTTLFEWVSFILAILPIWPIYIGIKAEIPFVHKYVNFWILVLLIVFIFGFAYNINAGSLGFLGGKFEQLQVGPVFNYLWEKIADIGKNFFKSINLLTVANKILNSTGINYYTGMVDQNEKTPVGLYIKNVRSADKFFYEGRPAIILADLTGKSFVSPINVNVKCLIDKKESGEARPANFRVTGSAYHTMSCVFNELMKGTYTAKFQATFDFETWSYVTYTFVNSERKLSIEQQGGNINSELDIPSNPVSKYTNGPVMLGMSPNIQMPVAVDAQYNLEEPVLGITLSNMWTEGQIESVDEFILMVPDDFKLINCDRWYPDTERAPFESKDGYDSYRFNREEIGDPRQTFQSITCWLHIKEPAKFLSGAEKVQRTFAAQAKYLYKLEKPLSITVQK